MSKRELILYHGTKFQFTRPEIEKSNPFSDYGRGFYCTKNLELAKEWSCSRLVQQETIGYVNKYSIDTANLKTFDFLSGGYNSLNWIATIIQNRELETDDADVAYAKNYLLDNFAVNLSGYDMVIGYRADDSYFKYATRFLEGRLNLDALTYAMYLGHLGEQYVIMNQETMDKMKFIEAIETNGKIYGPRYSKNDKTANDEYERIVGLPQVRKGFRVWNIIDEEVKDHDPRLSAYICKRGAEPIGKFL